MQQISELKLDGVAEASRMAPTDIARVIWERDLLAESINSVLSERIPELELSLEDKDWIRATLESNREFSPSALRSIRNMARIMYLKNPLIRRGVEVQTDYVFGQGVSIRGKHPKVNAVVQGFLDDDKNRVELTSHSAYIGKDRTLCIEGELFLVLFTNYATGRVRVRSISPDEITDIITDPEDSKTNWYYKREWSQVETNLESGATQTVAKAAYYPDMHYRPRLIERRETIGSIPVMWDSPVYHHKTGGLPDMKRGLCEYYSAIDWARAYKSFLEDWSTIVRAYARFAFQLTVKGGASAVAAAKQRFGTTLNPTSGETNPPPVAGSTMIAGEGNTLAPIRTAGATTSAEDGRRLLLMVAAAMGVPESFFGDVSVGTLATAKSLDRPTELRFKSRQTLWADMLRDILWYVLIAAVEATAPEKRDSIIGTVSDADGTVTLTLEVDPETNEPIDPTIEVTFPPILEHDPKESIGAIISGATLDGKAKADTITAKTLARLVLTTLGVEDIDNELELLFPEVGDGTDSAVDAQAARDAKAAATAKAVAANTQMQPGATDSTNETPPPETDASTANATQTEALAFTVALSNLRSVLVELGNKWYGLETEETPKG